MPADAAPAAAPLFSALYKGAEGGVFISSLLNQRRADGTSAEKKLITRNLGEVTGFLARWDQPGRAVYFCVNTILEVATQRSKGNIQKIVALHSDVDLKHLVDASKPTVVAALQALPYPPTAIVDSGHGVHAYWVLADRLEATPGNRDAVEAALRQLCDVVGGDPGVCEIARLMRLPGSHNSKDLTDIRPVTILAIDESRRYDFADLEEWLSVQSPVIHRVGRQAPPVNPWMTIAQSLGFKPPVDVEQRLAAMAYQGTGDSSVHQTQLSVSAALLKRGESLEDVVALLLDATRAAAGEMAERWNWRREEKAIRGMCQSWIEKHGTVPLPGNDSTTGGGQPPPPHGGSSPGAAQAPPPGGTPNAPKTAAAKVNRAETLARVTFEYLAQEGTPLVATEGSIWTYRGEVWKELDEEGSQWLKHALCVTARELGFTLTMRLVNESFAMLLSLPGVHDLTVIFDPEHVIPVANGVLRLSDDFSRFEFALSAPDQYVTWRLAVAFVAGAPLPTRFILFLLDVLEPFGEDREAIVGFLQEWIGCALLRPRQRELRKALVLHGPARTGKTQLAEILRQIYGSLNAASTSVKQLSSQFGPQALLHAHAWIADDAVGAKEDLADAVFKKIVTGESMDIERKYRSSVTKEFNMPVLLTGNMLPNIHDMSEGVFSRLVVIPLTRIFPEEGVTGGQRLSLAEGLVEAEGPAIMQWALGGAIRAVQRGRFDIPPVISAQVDEYRREQNPVLRFFQDCVERADGICVMLRDIHAAYAGWMHDTYGDDCKLMVQPSLEKLLRQGFPHTMRTIGQRRPIYHHIRLTEHGLDMRDDERRATINNGRPAGSDRAREHVNFASATKKHDQPF